ncbi:MAG: hypothetical protein QW140_00655 [Candidatus Aenigmatarchaeota archaeon]
MEYPIMEEFEETTQKKIKEKMVFYKSARILEIFTEGKGNPTMKEVGAIIGIIEPFFISKEELDEFRKEGSIYRVYTNGKAYIFCSRKSLTSFLSKNELKDFEASVEVIQYKGKII